MKRSEAFPTKYLSKDDVQPPIRVTLDYVTKEDFEADEEVKQKNVLYFQEDSIKPMVLNNTNWTILEDAYGEESDDWKGKPVELFNDPAVMFGGKKVGGVRIRIPRTTEPAKPSRTLKVATGFDMADFQKRIAQDEPYYAEDGKPNTFRIGTAIMKMGYSELSEENALEVMFNLIEYAKSQQGGAK